MDEYYEFYGYQQFSNKVKKLIQIKASTTSNKTMKEIEESVLKKYFSNRVLLIDEIHNLRDDNLKNYSKDTIKFLDKVIQYSDNLRLILMSATPMFNKATEIQWLLNLLLKNDKRPTISKFDIFDGNGMITEQGIQLLKKKTRGYVSYVEGRIQLHFLYDYIQMIIMINYVCRLIKKNYVLTIRVKILKRKYILKIPINLSS